MENEKGIEKVEDSKKGLTNQNKLRNKNKITDKTKLALTIIAMCVLHIMFQLFLILVHRTFSTYILLWFFGINLFIFIKEKEKENIITNITAIVAFVIVIVLSVISICVPNISYNDNYSVLIVFLCFIFFPVAEIGAFICNMRTTKNIKALICWFNFGYIIPAIMILILFMPYKITKVDSVSKIYKSTLFTEYIVDYENYGYAYCTGERISFGHVHHYIRFFNPTNKIITTDLNSKDLPEYLEKMQDYDKEK